MTDFFAETKAYIGWDHTDVERLRSLEPLLRPRFAEFADHFYAAMADHPRAMAAIRSPVQLDRLKATLVEFMASGLLGPHDDRFYDRRSRIGRRHVAIGLPQEYMFTAMNVLRLDYHRGLAAALDDVGALVAAIGSVDKLMDLELAIMLRHYQLDSEERVLERERRAQAEKLAAMQTLTAGLAHEIRNPLNAAKLQLELLDRRLRKITQNERLLDSAGLVGHEIGRLSGLINEFLAFARPPQLAVAPHDLVAIARQVVDLLLPSADAGGLSLEIEENDPTPVIAAVDPGKVHQIVHNLVRNAIEATPRGGAVTIAVTNGPDGAEIRVKDTGPGVPAEIRERIYEPFFSTKPEGTGMGMAIVHSLVAAHRGRIDLDTGPGQGASFTVTLPH